MSGKSELLTLTPLISARFYLRPGFFALLLHLKDLRIALVLCLQHIRDGKEVLHLKDLGVNITAKGVALFLLRSYVPSLIGQAKEN
jgi:hypothetical protein